MRVTVHYFGQLKRAAGVSSEAVAVGPGATLADLYEQLSAGKDEAFRSFLFDAEGRPRRVVHAFVGDEPAALADALRDGAEVHLLTLMAGGSDR